MNIKIKLFCENCPKVYKYKHDLKAHEKVHSSSNTQFICSDDGCEKVFSYKRNLKAHMKIHTDENQNIFVQCKITCKTKKLLKISYNIRS